MNFPAYLLLNPIQQLLRFYEASTKTCGTPVENWSNFRRTYEILEIWGRYARQNGQNWRVDAWRWTVPLWDGECSFPMRTMLPVRVAQQDIHGRLPWPLKTAGNSFLMSTTSCRVRPRASASVQRAMHNL